MRSVLAGLVVLAVGLPLAAEDLKGAKLPARYGIEANAEFYGQSTAKEAVQSAASLLEKRRYAYLVAHLLDPAFVDAEVAARAKRLEPAVEKRLEGVRAAQRGTLQPGVRADEVIPADPAGFQARVRADAEKEAFAEVVRAVEDNLSESPENVRQLAAVARDGTVTEAEATAVADLPSVTGKKVYLVRGSVTGVKEVTVFNPTTKLPQVIQQEVPTVRWYVQDNQREKAAAKPTEPKKEK